MGLYHKGIPENRALALARKHGIDTLVETGTQVGRTAVWAARHFKKVITIEVDEGYFGRTVEKHGHVQNIEFIYGDSGEVLLDVMPRLTTPAMFWLDAHWSRDLLYGRPEVICPVMTEIAAINTFPDPGHIIMIDDARLFLGENSWPYSMDVVKELQKFGNRHVSIEEDVFWSWPYGESDA